MNTQRPERLLLDNKNHGRVKDALQAAFKADTKLSVLAGLFSIYGFDELQTELRKCASTRMLLGDLEAITPQVLAGSNEESPLQANLDLQRIAAECAKWIASQAEVKGIERGPLHGCPAPRLGMSQSPVSSAHRAAKRPAWQGER